MANFGNELLKKESKDKDNSSTAIKDRDEKIRQVREKQNEDRQRKLEELKAQALAAQKFREQKDEERKKRIEDLKTKECDRRQQVEERKKVIWEAEKERRDYILKKNQEREARIDCKRKNERSSIVFAFGSSTPRMLDPVEASNISPSTFWNHRRATSITNVAFTGNTLTRRSSERDLSDVPKKRATSASGLDRKNEDKRHMSASMYEVFNWGHLKDERPKRFSLAIAGSHIDIDNPINSLVAVRGCNDDVKNSTPATYNSVARRKTDLMPTVPSPRDRSSYFGSRSSLGSLTPRTPGRAMSMTRLDQLAQPRRRNGEHISAIIEREKQRTSLALNNANNDNIKSISKSMTNLHGITNKKFSRNNLSDYSTINNKTLNKSNASKSMIHLASKKLSERNNATLKIRNDTHINRQKDVISLNNTGLRSGEVTPGGSIISSRPGSSMSSSICAGVVHRRLPRKPRPVSIAGTGVTTNGLSLAGGDLINSPKLRQEKPPLPRTLYNKTISTSKSPARSIENVKVNDNNNHKRTPNVKGLLSKSITSTSNSNNNNNNINNNNISNKTPNKVNNLDNKNNSAVTMTQRQQDIEIVELNKNIADNKNTLIQIEQQQQVDMTIQLKDEIKKEFEVEVNKQQEEINIDNINKIQDGIEKINIEISDEKSIITPPAVINTDNNNIIIKKKESSPEIEQLQQQLPQQQMQTMDIETTDMTASFMAKNRITTEEEAKAALAERRRLAREEAEKQAELEKLRLEEEEKLMILQQLEEEEQQKRLEEEAHRLASEQRRAEEERLAQAIEETQKRDKEDRERRNEEIRLKIEREEAERKARDEAEKQRIEMAERLKKEEKEREERRKRVEAIMSRTRAKNLAKNDSEKSIDENTDSTIQSNTTIDDQSNNIEISQQKNEIINDKIKEYENSVTEKENSLLGSFNDNITSINNTVKEDLLLQGNNGQNLNNPDFFFDHKNGHDFSINGAKVNAGGLVQSEINSDQLIDFSLPHNENFNNNSNNNRNTSTTLVTSDSQENRDLSFL